LSFAIYGLLSTKVINLGTITKHISSIQLGAKLNTNNREYDSEYDREYDRKYNRKYDSI
jgi:hypothetical protein